MHEEVLDDVDRRIVYLLQEDARNNTNSEISDRVGVSPSTVGNRIRGLESSGVIRGYKPNIDYEEAGYPFHVLFVCTTSIAARKRLIEEALEIRGVINVVELMTGEENIHIEVVGNENEDITRIATAIDDLGITINEEVLVKNSYPQPASVFGK